MGPPCPLQKFKVPPLTQHARESSTFRFRNADTGVISKYLKCAVEFISQGFCCKSNFVQGIKQLERCAGLDAKLGGRINLSTEELDVVREGTAATTILECNFVNPICVNNSQGGVAWKRVFTIHSAVVQLNFKTEGLQRHLVEKSSIPFLIRCQAF